MRERGNENALAAARVFRVLVFSNIQDRISSNGRGHCIRGRTIASSPANSGEAIDAIDSIEQPRRAHARDYSVVDFLRSVPRTTRETLRNELKEFFAGEKPFVPYEKK